MEKFFQLREIKTSILIFVMMLFLAGFIFSCSLIQGKEADKFSSSDKSRFLGAFKKFQIIGEGTDFLTVKCDINRSLSDRFSLQALVLDQDNQPLRKVSGYTYNPRLKGKNHLWFYFFLYDPSKAFHSSTKSHYIKFIVIKKDKVELEHIVRSPKTWGSKDKVKIFDLPAAPDQIPGHLILKDYTFLAKGDIRKPGGYYVAGKVMGHQGRWTHFIVTSDILGAEELAPKNILPVDVGWLELATGSTHSMKEAVSPAEPYVNGWWDGKGYFHPRPLKIFGLKKR
jgi:hypothetical protein